MPKPVSAREERFTLPIVPLFPPDSNPALPSFGDRAIYPYTRAYRFGAEPVEREMEALVLENELLNLQVVPGLGGRVWGTTNRQTNRPLFYTPKRVGMINFGLRGAWYSGGVEFNFPRGHTVIANEIVPAVLRHSPDGAAAAIVGGIDLTRRVGWSIGIRLEPGCSSIHFDIFLYNRTSLPVNYSWWLNASIPPSPELEYTNGTTEVRAHFLGRREHLGEPFHWPLHEGKDYRWYNQCVEPTSLFQLAGDERWFGYYLHDLDEGVIRIGSAADAPGLKFWNSGQAEEGYLWGKYQICGEERYSNSELQSGRPETQMDFGILPAHHHLRWTEVWRPVWGLGGVTSASEAVALHLLPDGNSSRLRLLGDRIYPDCRVFIRADGNEFHYPCNLNPKKPVTLSIPLPANSTPLTIEIVNDSGENIFSYCRPVDQTRRSARTDALHLRTEKEKTPQELTPEELILEAERMDRLMQPLVSIDLAEKALTQDQGLIAAHLLLARHDLRSALYEDARKHCLVALWRDPANEAADYLLALSELWAGNINQAEIEFEHMLGHSYLLSAAAWFELAQIRLARKDWNKGLQALSRCLEREANHIKAYALQAAVYRRLGRLPDAQRALNLALKLVPIDPLVRCELWCIAPEPKPANPWAPLPDKENQYIDLRSTSAVLQDSLETACDYLSCGFLEDAIVVLEATLGHLDTPDPMSLYFLGYLKQQVGDVEMASTLWQKASDHHGNYVFSFRREEENALRAALMYEPQDGLAHTLLGMLELHRLNIKKAVPELEQAIRLRPDWDQPIRLLSICQRMLGRVEEAAKTLEQAVAINPDNPGLYIELDELLASLVGGEDRRKKLWDTAPRSIFDGDHARGRFASFLIDGGEYERAIEILLEHTFFPEEGSSVYRDLFVFANLGLALQSVEAGRDKAALEYARKAASYPDCLGLSTPFICYDAPAMILQAAILQRCGDETDTRKLLERAAVERHREINEAEYFSGLAYRSLGQEQKAQAKFERLIEKSKLDAAWPGRDMDYCAFLAVLGSAGLGNEIPFLENLSPGMQKKAAIYVRLCKFFLPIQNEVKNRKFDDSFSKS